MEINKERVLNTVYYCLIGLVLALALTFLGVSGWAVFLRKDTPAATLPESHPNPSEAAFSGIGQLRLYTADSLTVIISVVFPYSPADRAFSEELVSRTPDFRAATAEYFRRFRGEEIARTDEDIIKANLLEQYNSLLRLGKIDVLYFNDYMILD